MHVTIRMGGKKNIQAENLINFQFCLKQMLQSLDKGEEEYW